MNIEMKSIDRILVVVDKEQLDMDRPAETQLVNRAVAVASSENAEIELFHVCYDGSMEQKTFFPDNDVLGEREKIANHYSTRLSELILGVRTSGSEIHQEVRWDSPVSEAILRRISEYQPDIVMLRSTDHNFFMGWFSHDDWELLREAPVPVWFVSDEVSSVKKIISAIGTMSNKERIIGRSDYGVFRLAETIARTFDADNYPLHAYQVPRKITSYAGYGPLIAPIDLALSQSIDDHEGTREKIAREHGDQIRAFAETFGIQPDHVQVSQGDPQKVIPETAENIDADLIVMGARNLSHWQRAVRKVTAEPVLADVKCDVLFFKADGSTETAVARKHLVSGSPLVDIESAVTKPESVFASPKDVAEESSLSLELQLHILEAWEQDIRAKLTLEDESNNQDALDSDLLGQVHRVKAVLEERLVDSPEHRQARSETA